MDFAADLNLFYADFGKSVTWAPQVGSPVTALALHDLPGDTLISGQLLSTDHVLRYPLASFPAVKRGDSFVIAGVAYVARESAQLIGVDGLEAAVPLYKS